MQDPADETRGEREMSAWHGGHHSISMCPFAGVLLRAPIRLLIHLLVSYLPPPPRAHHQQWAAVCIALASV